MVKARIDGDDGEPVYLLGLSSGNLMRLREGKPLLVNLSQFGGPNVKVAVCWGETEEDIVRDLNKAHMITVGPGTQ